MATQGVFPGQVRKAGRGPVSGAPPAGLRLRAPEGSPARSSSLAPFSQPTRRLFLLQVGRRHLLSTLSFPFASSTPWADQSWNCLILAQKWPGCEVPHLEQSLLFSPRAGVSEVVCGAHLLTLGHPSSVERGRFSGFCCITPGAYSDPINRGREQGGKGVCGLLACWGSAWLALHGPEGVNGAEIDRAWPSLSLPPPPPSIPFLWTSHPVFRFQPTYLSNLREPLPGLHRLLPAATSALLWLLSPAWRAPGHCPLGILLFLTPPAPTSPTVGADGELCDLAERSPLLGAVCRVGGVKGPLQPPTPTQAGLCCLSCLGS